MIRYTPTRLSGDNDTVLDLTALLDVIFTLIIFLILTMGTTQVLTDIRLSHSSQPVRTDEVENQTIVVEVRHQEDVFTVDQNEFGSLEAFAGYFLEQYGGSTRRPVVLALEKSLPVQRLIDLMDFLAVNGFANIQIVSEWNP